MEASIGNDEIAISSYIGAPGNPEVPATLGELLCRAASLAPSQEIVFLDRFGREGRISYENLLCEAQLAGARLSSKARKLGRNIVIALPSGRDFLRVMWGAILNGLTVVPFPVRDGEEIDLAKLSQWRKILGKSVVVCENHSKNGDAENGRFRKLVDDGHAITLDYLLRGDLAPSTPSSVNPTDIALVFMTSGSTGTPKGVMQTHQAILSRTQAAVRYCGFTANEVTLNWFPFDHVGALVMFHIQDLYSCCNQIHIQTGFILSDPLRWLDCIEKYQVTVTWAPNFAFALVNDQLAHHSERRWALEKLWFILNAGENINFSTAERFLRLLEKSGLSPTAMRPAWGMSETCSAVVYAPELQPPIKTSLGEFVCLGRAIPGVEMRIVDGDANVLGEGEIGSVQVKGTPVTLGYLDQVIGNRTAYFSSDGWFSTGDLGVIEKESLVLTGREKDILIVNGTNYSAQALESELSRALGIEAAFVAVCGVRPENADTDRLAVFFEPPQLNDPSGVYVDVICQTLASSFGLRPDIILGIPKTEFPRSSIGKVLKKELIRRKAAGMLRPQWEYQVESRQYLESHGAPSFDKNRSPSCRDGEWEAHSMPGDEIAPLSANEQKIADCIYEVTGVRTTRRESNIFSLGVDSINLYRVSSELHKRGIAIRPHEFFKFQTIGDLGRHVESAR